MEFRFIESDEFQRVGRQTGEIQDKFGDQLTEPQAKAYEFFEERAHMLHEIEASAGIQLAVTTDGVPNNVAAFVDTRSRKAYITLETLNPANRAWALYAAHHEAMHLKTGIFKISLEKYLSKGHISVLQEKMSGFDLHAVDLVEGFNDALTGDEHGENSNSGYLKEDVPAALKMEKIALKLTGESLLKSFRAGNLLHFYQILVEASDKMLLEQVITEMQISDDEDGELKKTVFQRMKEEKPIIVDGAEARRITKKLVVECLQMRELRDLLQN